MTDEGTATLPAAVTKAYDVLLWLITHVGKFPRSHRFVLGDRIESRTGLISGKHRRLSNTLAPAQSFPVGGTSC